MPLYGYCAGIGKALYRATHGIFASAETRPQLINGRQPLTRLPASAGEISREFIGYRLRDAFLHGKSLLLDKHLEESMQRIHVRPVDGGIKGLLALHDRLVAKRGEAVRVCVALDYGRRSVH